jgi:2-(1,2-epoxy-1,2-dihydrophenyl)acetyl-CoA isomerase
MEYNRKRQYINFEFHGGVGWIQINRPHARNSLCAQGMRELLDAFLYCYDLSGLKAIVMRGKGENFCSGGDVRFFNEILQEDSSQRQIRLRDYIGLAHRIILTMRSIPVPVITDAQGLIAGFGMSMAFMSDIVVADDTCRFVPAYSVLGTTPDGGLTKVLSTTLGEKRALDILLFNKTIGVDEALNFGLITKSVEKGQSGEAIDSLIRHISNSSPTATIGLKRLITSRNNECLDEHLGEELESFLYCSDTLDFCEGIRSFLEKRKPMFSGD